MMIVDGLIEAFFFLLITRLASIFESGKFLERKALRKIQNEWKVRTFKRK